MSPPPAPSPPKAATPYALAKLPAPVRPPSARPVDVPGDDDVSRDVRARIAHAAATYGGPLIHDDGRCPLTDLYQEALDAVAYATKAANPALVHQARALAHQALTALQAPTAAHSAPEVRTLRLADGGKYVDYTAPDDYAIIIGHRLLWCSPGEALRPLPTRATGDPVRDLAVVNAACEARDLPWRYALPETPQPSEGPA